MDTLMEFSIQGDIFFFYDTLSDEEKETVRKCMREKYKGHIVADPKIDECRCNRELCLTNNSYLLH